MIAALTLAVLAAVSIPEPERGIMRLYAPDAHRLLDNVEADPALIAPGGPLHGVGLTALAHAQFDPDTVDIDACIAVERARSLGVWAMPGMRVYNTKPVAILVTAVWWDERAVELDQLFRCASVDGALRVTVDVEDYGSTAILDIGTLGANGLTPDGLRGRMGRFLRLLSVRGVRAGVYPVNVNDEAHRAIGDTIETLEVWEEGSFDLAEDITERSSSYGNSFVGLSRNASAYRAAWPTVQIRYGLRDSFLRNQGHQMREAVNDIGPLAPWVFRYWRKPDESAIGSLVWVNGVDRDSRNDIANAWRWDSRILPLAFPTPTLSSALRMYFANGAINNAQTTLGTDGWLEVPAGSTFQVTPAPGIGNTPFTVIVSWRLNSDFLPDAERWVWGAAKVGTGSGDGRAWWLQVRTELDGARTAEACGRVPTTLCVPLHTDIDIGAPFRTAFVWDGVALTAHSVDEGGAYSSAIVGASYVGYPLIRIGQIRAQETGTIAVGDDVIIARRAWATAELATMSVGGERYPHNFAENGQWQ